MPKEAKVFVAGDARLGADLIVAAIAEGRKAARQTDQFLMGRVFYFLDRHQATGISQNLIAETCSL